MHRVIVGWFVTMLLVGSTACGRANTVLSPQPADRILVLKSAHTLSLMRGDRILRTYKVALGRSPVGPKTRKGDHKTPEGLYSIDAKKSIVGSIGRCISPIRMQAIVSGRKKRKMTQGAMWRFMVLRTDWDGSADYIEVLIGRMAVLR